MMWLVVIASVLLLPGCLGLRETAPVISDQRVPHQLAHDIDADVWVNLGDGKLVSQRVHIPAGWWVASPEVVDPPAR